MNIASSKRNALVFEFKDFKMHQALSGQRINTDSCVFASLTGSLVEPKTIVDIGTGTGVVALMLASKFPNAKILAVEPEDKILQIARENFDRSPWSSRISCLGVRAQDLAVMLNTKFDLNALNPPYFLSGPLAGEYLRAVARHTFSLGPKDVFSILADLMHDGSEGWISCPTIDLDHWIAAGKASGLNLFRRIYICDHMDAKSHIAVLGWSHTDKGLTEDRICYRDHQDGPPSPWMRAFRERWFPDVYNQRLWT